MATINLQDLYGFQSQLDLEIANKHNIDYKQTHERRLLALLVELGELANETRCFKYWSNKAPSAKEIIMDEYADGMHFFLSLGIPLMTQKMEYKIKDSKDLPVQFVNVYQAVAKMSEKYNLKNYQKAFQLYLNLSKGLGMTPEDIINSYKEKLSVNYKRQENNY